MVPDPRLKTSQDQVRLDILISSEGKLPGTTGLTFFDHTKAILICPTKPKTQHWTLTKYNWTKIPRHALLSSLINLKRRDVCYNNPYKWHKIKPVLKVLQHQPLWSEIKSHQISSLCIAKMFIIIKLSNPSFIQPLAGSILTHILIKLTFQPQCFHLNECCSWFLRKCFAPAPAPLSWLVTLHLGKGS